MQTMMMTEKSSNVDSSKWDHLESVVLEYSVKPRLGCLIVL